jgi:hypothetical protein
MDLYYRKYLLYSLSSNGIHHTQIFLTLTIAIARAMAVMVTSSITKAAVIAILVSSDMIVLHLGRKSVILQEIRNDLVGAGCVIL